MFLRIFTVMKWTSPLPNRNSIKLIWDIFFHKKYGVNFSNCFILFYRKCTEEIKNFLIYKILLSSFYFFHNCSDVIFFFPAIALFCFTGSLKKKQTIFLIYKILLYIPFIFFHHCSDAICKIYYCFYIGRDKFINYLIFFIFYYVSSCNFNARHILH